MNARKKRRLAFVLVLLVAGAGGAALAITALNDNVLYFYSPSDLATKHVAPGKFFRIGGLVAAGSITHDGGAEVLFAVTDGKKTVPVKFQGVLPALFRENQGVIAVGALNDKGTFDATQVLAKHDENYMPPEVVDALKRSGRWKEGGA
ncbi:MAG TPA: cytochrome c maturation protein CcmE [Rhizomicrobium sp.]|nr:cytochrome c maturation protein CcmE [Rhizomicrobium sp.]